MTKKDKDNWDTADHMENMDSFNYRISTGIFNVKKPNVQLKGPPQQQNVQDTWAQDLAERSEQTKQTKKDNKDS